MDHELDSRMKALRASFEDAAEAGNCLQRRRDNDERAAVVRKSETAVDEVITPEERILDVAAG